MAQNAAKMTPPMELLLRIRRGVRSADDCHIRARRRLLDTPRTGQEKPSGLVPHKGSPMLTNRCTSPGVSSPNTLAPGSASPFLAHVAATPTKYGDRFIPCRSKMNMDQSNFLLLNPSPCKFPTPIHKSIPRIKILQFSMNSPEENCQSETPSTIGATKEMKIKEIKTPDKVLDAPGVLPNHSLHLLDCSSNAFVALALDRCVYVWDANTKKTTLLCLSSPRFNITTVKWSPQGDVLAVASNDAKLRCWTEDGKLWKSLSCNYTVIDVTWNGNLLTSGDVRGYLRYYDLDNTYPSFPVYIVRGHRAVITSLAWNRRKELLSSGCANGLVKIWTVGDPIKPIHVLDLHMGTITVTEWCSWLNSVLAIATRTGRIFIVRSRDKAVILSVTVCESQVTDLKWSESTKEILTSHCNGQINFWSYPLMTNVKRITGHDGCILGLSFGPEAGRVLSLGEDETLRIWNCVKVTQDVQQEKSPLKICLR